VNEANVRLLYEIAEGVSLIAGIGLILSGMMGFKRYAQMRGMMGQQQSMAKPLLLMIGGSMLMVLPSILPALETTIFSTAQDSQYGPGLLNNAALSMFIHFLGLCSVIKGIIMLSKTGGHNAQPGMRGKAFIHILTGVLLLHVHDVATIASNFF